MPHELIPASFHEGLAGILLTLSCIFLVMSIVPSIRAHSIKMLSLLFVMSLALFAHQLTTYFAALFIVATSVTELEFLQNLAAIIRGDREYFKYKTKQLSSAEVAEKVRMEQQQQSTVPEGKISTARQTKLDVSNIVKLEAAALNKLEQHFGKLIQRNMGFIYGKLRLEFDGFIPNEGRNEAPEVFIEVKYLQNPRYLISITSQFERYVTSIREYMRLTGETAKLHIVLITKGSTKLSDTQLNELNQLIDSSDILGEYFVYSEEKLQAELSNLH
jgi:hypothetical protein